MEKNSTLFIPTKVNQQIKNNPCYKFIQKKEILLYCLQRKNIIGTQFHPEKSSFIGLDFLKLL